MSSTRRSLLTTGCLAAFVASATSQRSLLKQALPADTLAVFALPDLDKSVQELLDMPLLRMWRQKEFQDFVGAGLVELEKQWGQALAKAKAMHEQGDLPFSPDDLLRLRLYGATIAITHLRLLGDADPQPDLGLMFHLDFGPTAPMWKKVIGWGIEQIEAQAGQMLSKSEADAGGSKLTTWSLPEGPMGLNLAWVGDGIVVGTVQKDVAAALAALASKSKLLTESPAYKASAANVEMAGAEIEWFINFQRIYKTVFDVLESAEANAPDFPADFSVKGLDRALKALGLESIKSLAGTSTYQGNKAVTKSYVACPAPERKGLVGDGTKNLDLAPLKWVPKDATSCSASTMNFGELWDSMVSAFKAYDEKLASNALARLGEIEKRLGFTIRDDLVGAFGNQYVSWSKPMKGLPGIGGGSLFNGLFLVHMKDKKRLLECLDGLEQVSQGKLEFDSNTRDELTTYYLKANVDLPIDLPFNPLDMVQPFFGFQGDYMVLGFTRGDVRNTLKSMAAEKAEADTIRGNKDFAAMLASIKADRLTSVSFADNRATFDNVYQLAYGFSYMVPEDFPLDVKQLPDEGGFLSQHLGPSVAYSHTDGTGFSSTQWGPFGPEMGVLIGAVVAGAGIAYAAMGWPMGMR